MPGPSKRRVAWIDTVPEAEAGEELRPLYDAVRDRETGKVDHILAVHSLDPRGLEAHNALYAHAMRGTKSLRKVEREIVALLVSVENSCHY